MTTFDVQHRQDRGVSLLDADFLKKLEYLSLVSRRVFRGQLLAQRRTMQSGGGIEFADHRQYTPGDDFRYLDWNVFARHGELLLKRFQEEEDLHVYLFVDCSRSMDVGTPSKLLLAQQLAAALAYVALADLDRVSLVAFADRLIETYPLTRGKDQILSILRFLESLRPTDGDTNFQAVISDFVHRRQRNGLAVLVSDFYDPQGFHRGIDLLRHHRYETHLVQLFTAEEVAPNALGDIELVDAETGEVNRVTLTEAALRRYRKAYQRFIDEMDRYCANYGVGCLRATNEMSFDELVMKMMRTTGVLV